MPLLRRQKESNFLDLHRFLGWNGTILHYVRNEAERKKLCDQRNGSSDQITGDGHTAFSQRSLMEDISWR
jgi:hypothetical protein